MRIWIVYAIASAVCGAVVSLFSKAGLTPDVNAPAAAAFRAIMMAIFSILFVFWLDWRSFLEFISGQHSKSFLFLTISAVAGAVGWIFYLLALKTGTVAAATALDRLSVFFTMIFAAFFLAERLTLLSSIGIVMIVIGAILSGWK